MALQLESRLIGVRAASADTPHAYIVRGIGKSGATHVVSGKAFLAYYDIPFDVARRWPAERHDRKTLVIDLKQPGTDVSGHSSRAHTGGS